MMLRSRHWVALIIYIQEYGGINRKGFAASHLTIL